jgi:hypothetical protein
MTELECVLCEIEREYFDLFHTVMIVRIQVYSTNSNTMYRRFIKILEACWTVNDTSNVVMNHL